MRIISHCEIIIHWEKCIHSLIPPKYVPLSHIKCTKESSQPFWIGLYMKQPLWLAQHHPSRSTLKEYIWLGPSASWHEQQGHCTERRIQSAITLLTFQCVQSEGLFLAGISKWPLQLAVMSNWHSALEYIPHFLSWHHILHIWDNQQVTTFLFLSLCYNSVCCVNYRIVNQALFDTQQYTFPYQHVWCRKYS